MPSSTNQHTALIPKLPITNIVLGPSSSSPDQASSVLQSLLAAGEAPPKKQEDYSDQESNGMLISPRPPKISRHLIELLEAAPTQSNTQTIELLLHKWIKAETHCASSSLFMFCLLDGTNRAECSIAGEQNLNKSIDCGPIDLFTNMFTFCDELPSTSNHVPQCIRECIAQVYLASRVPSMAAYDKTPECQDNNNGPSTSQTSVEPDCQQDSTNANMNVPYTLLPIHAQSGLIAAMCLFHRAKGSASEEVAWLKPRLRLVASLLGIVLNIEHQKRLSDQSEIFISMAQSVFSNLDDMGQLVRNITKEAKQLVQAETCSLFLVEKDTQELVAEVFEKNGITDEYLTEIRIPFGQGVMGKVAATGELLNVTDAYSHPLFYRNVDSRTGFFTRNLLCVPIKAVTGEVIGVVELCNKMGRTHFTDSDESIATAFAVYAAISISHCMLYRKLQETRRRHELANELLISKTLSPEAITEHQVQQLATVPIRRPTDIHPHFNEINFVPRLLSETSQQLESCISMYNEMQLLRKHNINRRTLSRFLLTVRHGYRHIPYHNWSHAFAVTHYMYLLLRPTNTHSKLTELERLSLLTASLCHDIDHRGTNNTFQIKSKSPLAELYSSGESVLERHHYAQTVHILQQDDCNIFSELSKEDYRIVLDYIQEIILATDIATYFSRRQAISSMLAVGFDRTNREHHRLLMTVMMNTSDISDQSKEFSVSKSVAAKIYAEFFTQGDLEREMGSNPQLMMDRQKASIPKLQVDFYDSIALPLFGALSAILPESSISYDTMQHNKQCWEQMAVILAENADSDQNDAKPAATDNLSFLHDKSLEKRVLDQTPPPTSSLLSIDDLDCHNQSITGKQSLSASVNGHHDSKQNSHKRDNQALHRTMSEERHNSCQTPIILPVKKLSYNCSSTRVTTPQSLNPDRTRLVTTNSGDLIAQNMNVVVVKKDSTNSLTGKITRKISPAELGPTPVQRMDVRGTTSLGGQGAGQTSRQAAKQRCDVT